MSDLHVSEPLEPSARMQQEEFSHISYGEEFQKILTGLNKNLSVFEAKAEDMDEVEEGDTEEGQGDREEVVAR